MFSKYRNVFWLSVIMAVFYFVPFWVTGWSTDVWTRFSRIQEWAALGFPWQEQLTMTQNYPFGHEMHWTRPLDVIGYAFAWPFIPNYGLKRALELMSMFVPLLVLIAGIGAFFYALRGYVRPKMAFIAFWLFFWGVGYVWSQSSIGYFDHHVFHFTILMWVIALVARSYLREHNIPLLIMAGVLTALGTWITAEFFINTYIVLVPFIFYWLFYNRSLKPALVYSAAYTIALLGAMSFDHPIAGFWTLDFFRVSLFHVILGAMNCAVLGILMAFFKVFKTSLLRRFIYLTLVGCVYISFLLCCFCSILFVPMVDPFLYHFWTSKVGEMQPLYHYAVVVPYAIMPFILSVGSLIYALKERSHRNAPMMLLCSVGLLFYAVIYTFHVRVGVSANAFFILMATLYFNAVFFPREKGFMKTLIFLAFYGLFMGSFIKGHSVWARFQEIGRNVYRADFEKDPNAPMPEWLRKSLKREAAQKAKENNKEQNKDVENQTSNNQITPKSTYCGISDEVIEVIKKDNKNGGVFVDIFDAPELLWKTDKPSLSGPYHTNVAGGKAFFEIAVSHGHFDQAKRIIKERNLTQLYIKNPKCFQYFFYDTNADEYYPELDSSFYYTLYDGKKIPDWLELEYENKKTGEKIYRVKSDKL